MHSVKKNVICHPTTSEDETELRRGPWTLEEDTLLIHYIARHGEGHWNLLAKRAGLKRTGKSCRLRWLNYLKPDIKRGNLTPQEQLLILELHSKWGNRWSKIAQHLPGRTDNEIKNYWRTRVQKQARQLNIESNSKRFIDAVRCFWMPRLLQRVEQSSSSSTSSSTNSLSSASTIVPFVGDHSYEMSSLNIIPSLPQNNNPGISDSPQSSMISQIKHLPISIQPNGCLNSLTDFSFQSMPQIEEEPKPYTVSDSFALGQEYMTNSGNIPNDVHHFESINSVHYVDMLSSNDYGIEACLDLGHSFDIPGLSCHVEAYDWSMDDMASDTLWNMGEM